MVSFKCLWKHPSNILFAVRWNYAWHCPIVTIEGNLIYNNSSVRMETFKTWQRPPLGVKNVVSEKTQVRTLV